MESKAVAVWKPEWHLELDDVQERPGAECRFTEEHAPHPPGGGPPAQIQELFDGHRLREAAAVLRTLEAYLGPEAFRAGSTST